MEFTRAPERLDAEVVDELTVRNSRYRVVRADTFVLGPPGRSGPGPRIRIRVNLARVTGSPIRRPGS